MDVVFVGHTTFICPYLYRIYVVWRLWNGMYSQMHQPDVLLLVKETLSVTRESTFIPLSGGFVSLLIGSTGGTSLILYVCFELNTSCCVFSSFCGSGSGFSRQGACGHLQGEKQVRVCVWWLLFYFIFMSNKSVGSLTIETHLTLLIFLLSGLICKVSAGNEMAFQTTSYLSALSSREHLLLPLVLGLRRWAQVRFHVSCWALCVCVFVCLF